MKKRWLVVWTMAIGIFLCMLDTTIMNIALPAIQSGLHVSLNSLTWALNIYTILFAVLTIPLGQIADQFGRNRVYLIGLALFVTGSIISAGAPVVWALVIGRAVQSLGAAVVFPSSMTIGLGATELKDRSVTLTILGMTQGLAATLGPSVGGVLTTFLGWRWVFWINVPLGLIAVGLCIWLLPMTAPKHETKQNVDMLGMFIAMIMLFSLTLGLIYGRSIGWKNPKIWLLFVVFAISMLIFVFVERRASHPMVPLELFSSRQFSGATLASIIAQMLIVGVSVILPTFLTNVQDHTELVAALLITPMSVMTFLMAPISGRLLGRLGPRMMVFTGMGTLAAGYAVLSVMDPNQYWQLIIGCSIVGAGFGIIAGPIMILGASNFTGEMLTASQSVLGVIKQVGTLLAVAIFVSALTANIQSAKKQAVKDTISYSKTLKLPTSVRAHFVDQATQTIQEGGDSGKTAMVNGTQSAKQIDMIVKTESTKAIQKAGGSQLPASAQIKIRQKVRQRVLQRTQQIQHTMIIASHHIKGHTKNLISKSFFQAYLAALPIAILSISISLCFKRKRQI